ncbi:hypothetical protein E4U19_006891 [Claviceps sp. Clav32 group G5]|nr:hypothetical protein E4U40_005196 [Claviceps sp. LM458 group G5]KAG6033117.1 hypothetical protein E4U19_006891 [Claviceps sp. Clav32 group G5]KAG6043145.1 hypothetical protein E4U39_004885 [Claviceps sp. Clav50 group G5]
MNTITSVISASPRALDACNMGYAASARVKWCIGSRTQTPWYAYRDPEHLGHLVQHVGQHGKELKLFDISSGHRKYLLEMK